MLAPLTTHARVRMQQRGIPVVAVGPDDAVVTVAYRNRRLVQPA